MGKLALVSGGLLKARCLGALWGILAGTALASGVAAQIDRPYEPIVLSGDSALANSRLEVRNMRLLAYRAQEGRWEAVPFQVDEVNPKVRPWDRYFVAEDSLRGVFDIDDELVLMARDLGQQADTTQWPDTSDSLRLQIAFFDSLDGATGYVYLFWHDTLTEVPNPYRLAYDDSADHVESVVYRLGFNSTGQLADMSISSEVGGSGEDLFDRFKVRAIGSFVIFPIYMDEELLKAERAYARVGPVRLIRNLEGRFKGKIAFVDVDEAFTQTMLFYPYSGSFSLAALPLAEAKDLGVNIARFRASWDMNANAVGMRFYSAHNMAGIGVDGTKDQIDATCTPGRLNWTMVTGAAGTMVNLFHVPQLGDRIGLYYYDATDGKTADGHTLSKDTGDMVSYGDNGFLLADNIEKYFAPGATFSVEYHNYFLPPDVPPERAALMCAQAEHPLRATVSLQRRPSAPSAAAAAATGLPSDFFLVVHPNPCAGGTALTFSLSRPGRAAVEVYDLAGRCVARLVDQELPAGGHVRYWRARDDAGRAVPSGLYFARLVAGESVRVVKVLVVR